MVIVMLFTDHVWCDVCDDGDAHKQQVIRENNSEIKWALMNDNGGDNHVC